MDDTRRHASRAAGLHYHPVVSSWAHAAPGGDLNPESINHQIGELFAKLFPREDWKSDQEFTRRFAWLALQSEVTVISGVRCGHIQKLAKARFDRSVQLRRGEFGPGLKVP